MTLFWKRCHPNATLDHLGYIPQMLNSADPRSAAHQFNDSYAHGGGWSPFSGFTMLPNGDMQYEDPEEPDADPPTRKLWEATLHKETICVYEHAWVAIVQPDGSYEVSRMD